MVTPPLRSEVGRGFTVTVSLPVKPPANAVQCTSLNEVIVYLTEVAGVSSTVIGLLLPLNVLPVERIPLNGAVPVTLIVSVTALPAHVVEGPLIAAVGEEYTVIWVLSTRVLQFVTELVIVYLTV